MIEIVKELKQVIEEKKISPETAARFIGVSGREVRRWLEDGVIPLPISRQAIRRGIRRIRKNL
jgi:predicted site-specific integrase-resolvase